MMVTRHGDNLKLKCMIIYNVTTKVGSGISDRWLNWLIEEHIPEIIATGCFTGAKVLRLLETDDSEGPTYAIQYFAESKSMYDLYIGRHAEKLRQKAFSKWGDQFISFRSVMAVVH